jgi:hypothetical protein
MRPGYSILAIGGGYIILKKKGIQFHMRQRYCLLLEREKYNSMDIRSMLVSNK